MAEIKLDGNPINTNGDLPSAGSAAPDFSLTDGELNDVSLGDFAGKTLVMSIVPSLDTGVCAKSTKEFNERVAGRDDVNMVVVSADLPFAQGRFCSAESTDNVKALSMMRSRAFAKDYGVMITDGPLAGITARAVLVIDAGGNIVHSELVDDIVHEPNYDAALAVLG